MMVGIPSISYSASARLERAIHSSRSRCVDDEFRNHRIVIGDEVVTLSKCVVHSDADSARRVVGRQFAAGRGREILRGVLGVDAELHRVAFEFDLVLLEAERFVGRNTNLPLHDVHVGQPFRDAVFDLNPGVDFEEVEVRVRVEEFPCAARLVLFHEELEGSGVVVAGGVRTVAGGLGDLLAEFVRQRGRRAFLDDLLVTALERAVTLAEVAHVAVVVGDDLNLDVARVFEVAFEVDVGVVEVRLSLALGRFELVLGLVGAADDFHPAAATATLRLDCDGIAVLVAELRDFRRVLDGVGRPGDDGHVGRLHRLAGLRLLAELLHRLALGADPRHAVRGFDQRGEVGVLREEPVSGVNRVGTRLLRGVDDGLLVEVGLGGTGRADVVRFVGVANVSGVSVGIAVDGDGVDSEFLAGAHHADRDFPAICDQNLIEHSCENVFG